jgi:hypothetical protein
MILTDHARTMVDQDTFVVASADRIPVATSFVHDDHCCSEHNKSRTAAKPFLRMHDWGATLLAASRKKSIDVLSSRFDVS